MRFDAKWDQTCPHCGITEAAGYYCSRCYSATQKDWLHKRVVSESSKQALRASRPIPAPHRGS